MGANLGGYDVQISFSESGSDPNAPYTNTGGNDAAGTLTLYLDPGVTVTEESDAIQETDEPISLVVDGFGILSLTGPNTYSGGTTLAGGTLEVGDSGALGESNVTFTGAASLVATADISLSASITVNAGVSMTIAAAAGQYVMLAGSLAMDGGAGAAMNFGSLVDTGTVVLENSSIGWVTGGAVDIDGGTVSLDFGGIGVFSAAASVTVGAGSNLATLDLDTLTVSVSNLFGDAEGAITNNNSRGSATLSLVETENSSFAGVIEDGAGGMALALTGSEGITFTLTGVNSYTGGTTIDFGLTLQIGDGGTSGAITGSVADNGTLTFDLSDNVSFSGGISGAGGVRILGSGETTLSGDNSFSGGVLISAGMLDLASASAAGANTITFATPSAELVIEAGDIPANAIAGLAVGDSLDLVGVKATGAKVNASNELVLTLKGADVATLKLSGAEKALHFVTLARGEATEVCVAATLAQYAADKTTLDASPEGFAIDDAASNIEKKLGSLDRDANLKTIVATGGAVTASSATFGADKSALDKIAGGFVFDDTLAKVKTELAALEADVDHVSSIHITGSGAPALSVAAAQATADARAIAKIAAPYVLDVHDASGAWTTTGHGNGLKIDDVKGRDTITGGGKSETFVFAASFGQASITDFHEHLSGGARDAIDLARSEFLSIADLKMDAEKSEANVVIKGTGGDRLTLDDMTVAAFDNALGDFKLVA
jgi:autotransporter-associated beta strand protein